MTPTEFNLLFLFAGGFLAIIIAIIIGYGAGYIDGRASKRLWTEDEIKQKLRNN